MLAPMQGFYFANTLNDIEHPLVPSWHFYTYPIFQDISSLTKPAALQFPKAQADACANIRQHFTI